MCNIRRFYLLRELYAADFHKPGIYGNAGEYGPTRGMCFDARRLEVVAVLTRGTCFVARRLEVVAVAGLLWISWCVFGGANFFRVLLFFRFVVLFERTRPATSMRPPCLIYLSTSNEAVFCL